MDLQLTVGGATARVRLWTEFAPNTIETISRGLPVAGAFTHCRWSGDACFWTLPLEPFAEITEFEGPAVSLYPGTLALRLTDPLAPNPELLISYGTSEHRWPQGPKVVTPIGEIVGDPAAVFKVLANTILTGPVSFELARRKGDQL